MAKSASDALKKEKFVRADECYFDDNYQKQIEGFRDKK